MMHLDHRIKRIMTMFHYHGSLVITGMNGRYICMCIPNSYSDTDIFFLVPMNRKNTFYKWDNKTTINVIWKFQKGVWHFQHGNHTRYHKNKKLYDSITKP